MEIRKQGDVVHASPAVSRKEPCTWKLGPATSTLSERSHRRSDIWKFETGDDPQVGDNQIGIASSAAVANGTVFFGCRDGHFYAVDAKTGKMRWREDNKMGWTIGSPAVRRTASCTSRPPRVRRLKAVDARPMERARVQHREQHPSRSPPPPSAGGLPVLRHPTTAAFKSIGMRRPEQGNQRSRPTATNQMPPNTSTPSRCDESRCARHGLHARRHDHWPRTAVSAWFDSFVARNLGQRFVRR